MDRRRGAQPARPRPRGARPTAAGRDRDRPGARRATHDLTVGQTGHGAHAGRAGSRPRSSGITKFGSADSIDGERHGLAARQTRVRLAELGQVEYDEPLPARLGLAGGARGRGRSRSCPSGFEAQTGDAVPRRPARHDRRASGGCLKNALQGFAILALLVGAFVIYNTFSVIVAQRMRELAVLAAIGATPEADQAARCAGRASSSACSGSAPRRGGGHRADLRADRSSCRPLGVALPGSGIEVEPATSSCGVVIGTVITVASVMIPARRARRTEPIEAMRDAAVETVGVLARRAVIATIVLAGPRRGRRAARRRAPRASASAPCSLFVGVIVAGPVIAAVRATRLVTPAAVAPRARGPPRRRQHGAEPQAHRHDRQRPAHRRVPGDAGDGRRHERSRTSSSARSRSIDSADYLVDSDGRTVDTTWSATSSPSRTSTRSARSGASR